MQTIYRTPQESYSSNNRAQRRCNRKLSGGCSSETVNTSHMLSNSCWLPKLTLSQMSLYTSRISPPIQCNWRSPPTHLFSYLFSFVHWIKYVLIIFCILTDSIKRIFKNVWMHEIWSAPNSNNTKSPFVFEVRRILVMYENLKLALI